MDLIQTPDDYGNKITYKHTLCDFLVSRFQKLNGNANTI